MRLFHRLAIAGNCRYVSRYPALYALIAELSTLIQNVFGGSGAFT